MSTPLNERESSIDREIESRNREGERERERESERERKKERAEMLKCILWEARKM